MNGILAKKLGMTQVFTEQGECVPVTVLEAGPCVVVCHKTEEKDGYTAVQIGFGLKKEQRANKAEVGHFKKADVAVDGSTGIYNRKGAKVYDNRCCTVYNDAAGCDIECSDGNAVFVSHGIRACPVRNNEIDCCTGICHKAVLIDVESSFWLGSRKFRCVTRYRCWVSGAVPCDKGKAENGEGCE